MARRYGAQLTIVQAFVPGPAPNGAETEPAVYAEQIAGPGTRARVAAGDAPASAIVAAAEAEQADVLVVGNIAMSGAGSSCWIRSEGSTTPPARS